MLLLLFDSVCFFENLYNCIVSYVANIRLNSESNILFLTRNVQIPPLLWVTIFCLKLNSLKEHLLHRLANLSFGIPRLKKEWLEKLSRHHVLLKFQKICWYIIQEGSKLYAEQAQVTLAIAKVHLEHFFDRGYKKNCFSSFSYIYIYIYMYT
jgi:hypothetical protein